MTTYTEPRRPLESVLYETPELSRSVVTVPSGTAAIEANSVLGYQRATAAVGAETTAGNGAFVADSVSADATAQAGVYTLTAIASTKCLLHAPDGAFLSYYTIGDAYDANGITFDTEGTWAAGDTATITVTHTDAVGLYNATGPVIGVALYPVDASSAAASVTTIERLGAVAAAALVWHADLTDEQKTAAAAALAANHLYVRS